MRPLSELAQAVYNSLELHSRPVLNVIDDCHRQGLMNYEEAHVLREAYLGRVKSREGLKIEHTTERRYFIREWILQLRVDEAKFPPLKWD